MDSKQMQRYLDLDREFGALDPAAEKALAQSVRNALDGEVLRRIEYQALKTAYEQSQRVLRQYSTNGEKECHVSAMKAALELAAWPEMFTKQALDKPPAKPYESHWRKRR